MFVPGPVVVPGPMVLSAGLSGTSVVHGFERPRPGCRGGSHVSAYALSGTVIWRVGLRPRHYAMSGSAIAHVGTEYT
eukprot:2101291-Rhodomonas_salina.1